MHLKPLILSLLLGYCALGCFDAVAILLLEGSLLLVAEPNPLYDLAAGMLEQGKGRLLLLKRQDLCFESADSPLLLFAWTHWA